jgi:hypothetical protein
MAHRRKADHRFHAFSHQLLRWPRWSLTNDDRKQLAASLDLDWENANTLRLPAMDARFVLRRKPDYYASFELPPNATLWSGFEEAIDRVLLDLTAEKTGAPVTTGMRMLNKFIEQHTANYHTYLSLVKAGVRDALESVRTNWDDLFAEGKVKTMSLEDAEQALRDILVAFPILAAQIDKAARWDHRREFLGAFLCRITLLVQAAGVRTTLPSTADNAHPERHPLFNTARAAVKIAAERAQQLAPAAVSDLTYLRNLADATFVEWLRKGTKDAGVRRRKGTKNAGVKGRLPGQ